MAVRWIKRYKVGWNGPADQLGGYCLDYDMVLQEEVKILKDDPGEGHYYVREWQDVETFDDLETKEVAIEKLQKLGVNIPLKVRG